MTVLSRAARAATTGRTGAPGDPYSPVLLRLSRVVSRGVLRALFRVTVEGSEHVPRSGPLLLAGNHVGSLDGPLVVMMGPRLVRAMAKAEFFALPGGAALAAIGQIPVERGKPDRAALRAGLAVLASGGALAVFPEGECGPGTLEQVHPGVAWLALRSQAPVLPVACFGTDRAVANGDWRPRLRAPVRIVFGPAFSVDVPAGLPPRRAVAHALEDVRTQLVRHVQASAG